MIGPRERRHHLFEPWLREKFFLGLSLGQYLRVIATPLNLLAGLIVLAGFLILAKRFALGLAAITDASSVQPWGLLLGYGLFSGVPLAASGYIMASAVYLFGLKAYHPLVRMAVLAGFLGYFFAVVFLLIDLGRPWRLPYPMFVSFGPASVLFLVAWHVALYLSVQFIEFCPSIFEWLGAEKFRKWTVSLTVVATIGGVILSTLHQSALGALFLLAPGKLHPLWYSPFMPLFFFVSSIFAGISVVIFISLLAHRFSSARADPAVTATLNNLALGLAKASAIVMFTYLALKLLGVADGNHWDLLNTPFGYWFLVEVFIFVFLPGVLFVLGVYTSRVSLVWLTSLLTIVGVIVNRLNVSLIAFNWDLPQREMPRGEEFVIVISVLTLAVLTFRWIVNRMPVLPGHTGYKSRNSKPWGQL